MIPFEDWIQNGTVWENDAFRFIVQWLDKDTWGLLTQPYKAAEHPGTAMQLRSVNGKVFLSKEEIADFFAQNKYHPISAEILLDVQYWTETEILAAKAKAEELAKFFGVHKEKPHPKLQQITDEAQLRAAYSGERFVIRNETTSSYLYIDHNGEEQFGGRVEATEFDDIKMAQVIRGITLKNFILPLEALRIYKANRCPACELLQDKCIEDCPNGPGKSYG